MDVDFLLTTDNIATVHGMILLKRMAVSATGLKKHKRDLEDLEELSHS